MSRLTRLKIALITGICLVAASAHAEDFNIPGGDLATALSSYTKQTGVDLMVSGNDVKGVHTPGVRGNLTVDDALSRILTGTGFRMKRAPSGGLAIVRDTSSSANDESLLQLAQAAPAKAIETVTVTSSKLGGADVQSIPIAITALSQEQLTATQTAGGPDLIKQVPNMSFTKTNFSGYSIQLRGIGTQAISVTTDPAVAVAFNDMPFIRNHFFEQEFYDVSQVEVLRGPQGTLYGRNATAGVVNLISAKPSDQFEAMASADIGNYENRRFEGMINIPIVDDQLDLRVAGEWTKRQGYSFNEITDSPIDGRDLWSGRVTLGWKPFEDVQATLVWEHFSEDDDRLRSGKQLCETAPIPAEVGGELVGGGGGIAAYTSANYLSQGCEATSLYAKSAFEVPNGNTLPYYAPLSSVGVPVGGDAYATTTQSTNLRHIESTINPHYSAKNDVVELNTDYHVTPALTFSSQTGFNHDFLWSTEDYNRFDSTPNAFGAGILDSTTLDPKTGSYIFCDPQLGCSERLVAEDLNDEHAWQLGQEFRLSSNFSGPFNFSFGGNYLHYETEENYYVFINSLTLAAYDWYHVGIQSGPSGSLPQNEPWVPGVSDNSNCLTYGFEYPVFNPSNPHSQIYGRLGTEGGTACQYIDPNPLSSLNNKGHNYFLSQNPYMLNSYAGFGETYYNIFKDLKLTAGLRWTDDQKHFVDIPSELLIAGYGYPITGIINQQWDKWTGRAAINWTPKLDFTDQTLVYASYAHGYKAGGANPPGAELLTFSGADNPDPIHPLTFKPEFIEAFELGSKNTLLDGALTLNGDVFYYNYTGYQISEIVDRTAINNNYNAHVEGAEVESNWELLPGLRFNFAGGWEDTAAARGDSGVDLMDRTAGSQGATCTDIPNPAPGSSGQALSCNSGWIVVKPFVTQASNCILPDYVVAAALAAGGAAPGNGGVPGLCGDAYNRHVDPLTGQPYEPFPQDDPNYKGYRIAIPADYPGFDPLSVDPNAPANVNNGLGLPQNNGEGFSKNLSGNKLPNAPPFTVSAGAQYTIPLTTDWAGTMRGDYYWQDYSWARIFNDNPYDRLRGYTNVNLTLIFTNQNGWQVMLYDKNVFNTTAITGDFLNSDDSGLTTNVFLTDPRLIGIRVTKNW